MRGSLLLVTGCLEFVCGGWIGGFFFADVGQGPPGLAEN